MAEVLRMQTASGVGHELKRYEDVIFSIAEEMDPECSVTYVREFKYKQADILLCSYPKSGTHWLGNMVWKLKTLDKSKRAADAILEFGPPEIFETMETPRIMFTHFRPKRLPQEHFQNRGKVMLILRNPKDVMVSLYHHAKKAVLIQNNQTWDEFFKSFTSGSVFFGSYIDYLQEWEHFLREKPTDQHVEIFYYEDLKTNLNYNVARLNNFLGFNRNQEYIETVKEETTFQALREQDAAGKRETIKMARGADGDSVIYRKGIVGDWKNYFTVAQSEIVDKLMAEKLNFGIFNFKYDI